MPSELEAREHAWEHAYLSTPHGKPVKLASQGVGSAPSAEN